MSSDLRDKALALLNSAKRDDETVSTIEQCELDEVVRVLVCDPQNPFKPMVANGKVLGKNSEYKESLMKFSAGYTEFEYSEPCLRQENWQAKQTELSAMFDFDNNYDFDQDE